VKRKREEKRKQMFCFLSLIFNAISYWYNCYNLSFPIIS